MKKWGSILLYLVLLGLVLLNKDELLAWAQNGDATQIPLMILFATLAGLFPVIPYGIIAGIMGSKYGLVWGGLINVTGSTLAALLMYLVVRYVFYQAGREFLKKSSKLEKFNQMVEQNAFLAILIARMIPIVPAPVVNIYSAIAGISFGVFAFATVIGKIPVMLVFAIMGDQIFTNPRNMILTIVVYSLFLAVVTGCYRYWIKRKKGEAYARS